MYSNSKTELTNYTIASTYYIRKTYMSAPISFAELVTLGLPDMRIPWHESRSGNTTITLTQKVKMLYSGMIVIPIVALLVHVTIAKFFGEYFSRVLFAFFSSQKIKSFSLIAYS